MIFGIGIDLVSIDRIKKIILKYGNKFIEKIFTKNEIKLSKKYKNIEQFFAGRWAAKESIYKALNTKNINSNWLNLSILQKNNGEPKVQTNGSIDKFLKRLNVKNVFLSITHERNTVIALAVLDK